jgi:ABC-2 type transport system permease protein
MSTTMTPPAPPVARSARDRAVPFGVLARVEWSKATDTRAARWLLAITAAATVLIVLAPLIATGHVDQDFRGYVGFVSTPLAFLVPIVAILTLTSEWTQRTVLTTFTQVPRRGRVLGAKVTAVLALTVVMIALVAAVTFAGLALSSGLGRDVHLHLGVGLVVGLVLYGLLNTLVGVAFGAALQNSSAAIVLSLLLPTVMGIVGGLVPTVQHWFDTSTTFGWVLDGHWSGHVGGIVTTIAVWIVAPLAIGVVRTLRREVK